MDEPKTIGAKVVDTSGDLWKRDDNGLWDCVTDDSSRYKSWTWKELSSRYYTLTPFHDDLSPSFSYSEISISLDELIKQAQEARERSEAIVTELRNTLVRVRQALVDLGVSEENVEYKPLIAPAAGAQNGKRVEKDSPIIQDGPIQGLAQTRVYL